MMSRTVRSVLLLGLLALAGCEDRPATQVMISLATDLRAPQELRQLSMTLERFVEEQRIWIPIDPDVTKEWEISQPPQGFELPGSLVTFTSEKDTPKVRATIIAQDPTGPMIRRRSIFRLVREKTLYMRMGITSRCLDNADCPDDKTCMEGRCRDPELFRLPEYLPEKRPELAVECDSGTAFRNTTTGAPLPMISMACAANQICLEGACYPNDVFGVALPMSQPLTINVQVANGVTGMPVTGAEIRTEDGPVTLVRRLRNASTPPAAPTMGVTPMGSGVYQVLTQTDPLTTELRLTVSAPNFAPQIVTVPFKPGVGLYQVPAVLFPLAEATLMPSETRPLMLQGGGRMATLQLPAPTSAPLTVRYALTDGRYLPGQANRSGAAGDLLQAVAVLYLENVGQSAFPASTQITLGTSSTPPVFGAEGGAAAYLLDLQGQWKRPMNGGFEDTAVPRLIPSNGGFWAVANLTPRASCVRGKILRPDRTACAGARVRLLGPEGVTSSDSTAADGGFCGGAAQQEAAILAVGSSTRVIYVPASPRPGAHCGQADACIDVGEVIVRAEDCDLPPALIAGRRQTGDSCTNTLECAGLVSCHEGFCVGESFARVSMTWTAKSDFDLHLRKMPGDKLITVTSREVKGVGRMDVEQCSTQCLGDKHVENIVLSGDPGTYEVWVQNFGGVAAGDATIDVFVGGRRREVTPMVVNVPATQDARSQSVTFTLP
ncbi:MAG TPA: hypothetical protein VGG33_03680 [Polyangia bacterium]